MVPPTTGSKASTNKCSDSTESAFLENIYTGYSSSSCENAEQYPDVHKTVRPSSQLKNSTDGSNLLIGTGGQSKNSFFSGKRKVDLLEKTQRPGNSKSVWFTAESVDTINKDILIYAGYSSSTGENANQYQDVQKTVSPLSQFENSADGIPETPTNDSETNLEDSVGKTKDPNQEVHKTVTSFNALNITVDPNLVALLNTECSDSSDSESPYKEARKEVIPLDSDESS